ncbi:MAG: dihydrodipicolinate synthase family protein [Eubacteriales bacterium]
MITSAKSGAYVTMVTPYNNDNTVDYGAVRELVRWYASSGLDGIFASCQSSEIWYLSLADRVKLAAVVRDEAEKCAVGGQRMQIVASGHVSNDFDEQVAELSAVAATGVDAVILISNRMDIADTSEDKWISDTDRLIGHIDADVALGVYECPLPYKRLMTDKMLSYCSANGRFFFMKDTCCDADMIARRLKVLGGGNMKLFNANAQTTLASMLSGGAGYCGVMANFHPALYKWLCDNYAGDPRAQEISAQLSMMAFIEGMTYPACAKYHMRKYSGLNISEQSRSCRASSFTPYQRSIVDALAITERGIYEKLEIK